ncbi:MAG: transketolase [Chloroflexi bacterium]|nr:transketolase [Chloroflexota bacterium]
MVQALGHGYLGQGLGVADILTAVYFHELARDEAQPIDAWLADPDRGRFVLSVGHYAIALFGVLAELGAYTDEELATYGQDGSDVEQNATEFAKGFEVTGGSLGQGLSQAIGMALGARLRTLEGRKAYRVYALVSDGELQEGQVWEAIMSAAHYRLDNLVAIFDLNQIQADGPPATVMGIEPVHEKLRAFGWNVSRVDGNDLAALLAAFAEARTVQGQPSAIVCDTLPGRGVPSIEQREKVHYVRPRDPRELDGLIEELETEAAAWR